MLNRRSFFRITAAVAAGLSAVALGVNAKPEQVHAEAVSTLQPLMGGIIPETNRLAIIGEDGCEVFVAMDPCTVGDELIEVSWTAVPGAARYRVYATSDGSAAAYFVQRSPSANGPWVSVPEVLHR